jgi:hypothetical protein
METSGIFSKKLDAYQAKYSEFDRELLAAYHSVWHFRYLLDGRKFHNLPVHKPLKQAMHIGSPRVQRQLSFLAELTSDVRHFAGKANVVSDVISTPPPVSFRGAVISAIHSIAHPGIRATKRLITSRFAWRRMGVYIS